MSGEDPTNELLSDEDIAAAQGADAEPTEASPAGQDASEVGEAAIGDISSLDEQLAALADDLIAGDLEDGEGTVVGSEVAASPSAEPSTEESAEPSAEQSAGASVETSEPPTPKAVSDANPEVVDDPTQEVAPEAPSAIVDEPTLQAVVEAVGTPNPSEAVEPASEESVEQAVVEDESDLLEQGFVDPDEIEAAQGAETAEPEPSAPPTEDSAPKATEEAKGAESPVIVESAEAESQADTAADAVNETEAVTATDATAGAQTDEVSEDAPEIAKSAKSKPGPLDRVRAIAGRVAVMAKPIVLKGLVALSSPLQGHSPVLRKVVGLVAIWTTVLAAMMVYKVLTRSANTPQVSEDPTELTSDPEPKPAVVDD